MATPPKLGTIWAAWAKVKFIDDSGNVPKWVTVETVSDTPRHIGIAVSRARKLHPGKTFWVHDMAGSKYIAK